MIAVIKGDIINSRKVKNPEKWLLPLKELLSQWGETPADWEVVWGDFFQLEIADPLEALQKAISIKALIKTILPGGTDKRVSDLDVRISIGIGEKSYTGRRISESNGQAFIFAGEKFDSLKKDKNTLAVKSGYSSFDAEINLLLKLASIFMDKWSVKASELVFQVLKNPEAMQAEIGDILNVKQNTVSGRWHRANLDEVLQIDALYRQKLKALLS